MRVLGYTDRFSAPPGGRIRFMISCQESRYSVQAVRLRHGDINPAGPGFKAEPVASPVDGFHPGREQGLRLGSYVAVDSGGPLEALRSFTLAAWIWPTRVTGGEQALIGRWITSERRGIGLILTGTGEATFHLGDGKDVAVLRAPAPLRMHSWYFIAASYDAERGHAALHVLPQTPWPLDPASAAQHLKAASICPTLPPLPFLIAAAHDDPSLVGAHFNGKIDRPLVFASVLNGEELERLCRNGAGAIIEPAVAAWDFAADIGSARVTDASPNGLHGVAVNMPTRGVTGHNWSGKETRYSLCPAEYSAIHFHDDDLDDAGWALDFELEVPSGWRSGVYALRLSAGDFDDYVPFFVRPARDTARAPILWLAPTLTYLAYANDHMVSAMNKLGSAPGETLDHFLDGATAYEAAAFRYIIEHRLHSMYNQHEDGSGVCYASRLRPLVNFRPRYNKPNLGFKFPHLFNCDLYLVDWLQAKDYDYEVVTDEDLHAEGHALLAPYRVVVTGTHPEYWTEPMLRALKAYLAAGGRLMYLGGNGFYWVTSIDPARPHLIEVRRGASGSRPWTSAPGEHYHSTKGELGGIWRYRGHVPQAMLGIGFSAQCGPDRASPYRRTVASRDPRAAFIFEGVEDEVIGDFGLHMGGAAGWELDRADPALGTPPHALVLAASFGHSDAYQHVVEEVSDMNPEQGGSVNPLVRADLTYFEGPADGAVFSVGSISWCGSLSHNVYDNNISKITANVLDRFSGRRDGYP